MQILNLEHNEIEEIPSWDVRSLDTGMIPIIELNMSNNNIDEIHYEFLCQSQNLEVLMLEENLVRH